MGSVIHMLWTYRRTLDVGVLVSLSDITCNFVAIQTSHLNHVVCILCPAVHNIKLIRFQVCERICGLSGCRDINSIMLWMNIRRNLITVSLMKPLKKNTQIQLHGAYVLVSAFVVKITPMFWKKCLNNDCHRMHTPHLPRDICPKHLWKSHLPLHQIELIIRGDLDFKIS